MSSWRKKYPAHPATEVFPMLGGDDMDQLVADIDENGILVPVVMYRDDDGKVWTLDGRNRLEARERIRPGRDDWDLEGNPPDVPCIWANEEGYDPVSFVISANAHRRHLTPEQKRDLIARLLKRDASRSDRQIARDVRASPTTVGRERRKLEESGRVSKVDTRTDSAGRKQPGTKPKPKKVTPADPAKVTPAEPEKVTPADSKNGTAPTPALPAWMEELGEVIEKLIAIEFDPLPPETPTETVKVARKYSTTLIRRGNAIQATINDMTKARLVGVARHFRHRPVYDAAKLGCFPHRTRVPLVDPLCQLPRL